MLQIFKRAKGGVLNYFLDTNICIYFLKGMYPNIKNVLFSKKPKNIKIPSMVKGELLLGAEKSNNPKKTKEMVAEFLAPYEIISFDSDTSEIYAQIRGYLEKKGDIIGSNDLIIASTVLSSNGTLITNNQTEFKRIKSLKIESWI